MIKLAKALSISTVLSVILTLSLFYSFHIGIKGTTFEETNFVVERELFYAKQFFLGTNEIFENHLINKKINKAALNGERVYEPVVCLLDTDEDDHHKDVAAVLAAHYTGPTLFFDHDEQYFDISEEKNRQLLECDIINYSSGITIETEGQSAYEEGLIEEFLTEYDGIVVASAGNIENKDTYYQQEFVRVRENNSETENHIIISGQVGEDNKEAYGKDIDITVPNASYIFEGKRRVSGTSLAAPVVSAVVANLMAVYPNKGAEWYKTRALQHIDTFNEIKDGAEYRYPLLNIEYIYNQ